MESEARHFKWRTAENRPGHKPLKQYNLPTWIAHPELPQAPTAAVLFPGEHNQYLGMLAACKRIPAVREMLEMATECFGFDVEQMMSEGDPELMARTDYTQMLMYVANCAAWEVLKQDHPSVLEGPYCVAGWSVGEFAALVAAGVMSYDQGLIIVKARADALYRWSIKKDMMSIGVFGLGEEDLLQCLDYARDREYADGCKEDPQVYISHYIGREFFVCSGLRSTVELLRSILESDKGIFLHVLENTTDAAHTPLAEEVLSEVEEAMQSIPMEPPKCEVYLNQGSRVPAEEDPHAFEEYILNQMVVPLRWDLTIQGCMQRGVRDFYEVGPGESLKDLMIYHASTNSMQEYKPYAHTKSVPV